MATATAREALLAEPRARLSETTPELQLPIAIRWLEAFADEIDRITGINKNLEAALDNLLKQIPGAIRVREGGGPEDIEKSVALTLAAIKLVKPTEPLSN